MLQGRKPFKNLLFGFLFIIKSLDTFGCEGGSSKLAKFRINVNFDNDKGRKQLLQ